MKRDPKHDKTPIEIEGTADGELFVYRHQGAVCVELGEHALSNRLSFEQLRNALDKLIEDNNPPRLIIDLEKVDTIRSEVLGLLLSLQQQAAARDGGVALVGVKKEVKQVLHITALSKKLKLCDDVPAAISSFKKPWWKLGG